MKITILHIKLWHNHKEKSNFIILKQYFDCSSLVGYILRTKRSAKNSSFILSHPTVNNKNGIDIPHV